MTTNKSNVLRHTRDDGRMSQTSIRRPVATTLEQTRPSIQCKWIQNEESTFITTPTISRIENVYEIPNQF